MWVGNPDIVTDILPAVISLRHTIHSKPDLSAHEEATASRLLEFLTPFKPDQILSGLGGCGLAIIFAGSQPGPTTLFTCELDALPISEQGQVKYRSQVPGAGHMCGHDGHMATVAGLGALLDRCRLVRGRVVLLFRPQEETGIGAPAVVADPRVAELQPDYVFGFHNMPGFPLGTVLYRRGQFAWAAADYVIELIGKSSHGGQPAAGQSPAMALSQVIDRFENLSVWSGLNPQRNASQAAYAQLGEADHGTTPGIARMRATVRSQTEEELKQLYRKVDQMVAGIARTYGLRWQGWPEKGIPATYNHDKALDLMIASAQHAGLPLFELEQAQRWSDDFGVLLQHYPGVFFGFGSGTRCGQLHGPDFDFPDAILDPALRLYLTIVDELNGLE